MKYIKEGMNTFMKEKINLPITGICSFAKYPICTDLENLDADIAVMGIPYDMGAPYLSGAKLGPRRIREVSTHYGRGNKGFYDPERDESYLEAPIKIVDCGDVDMVPCDLNGSFENITAAVRKIIEKGAIPAMMGGDHSVTIPTARALDCYDDVVVVQFDAHLDWTNIKGGQRFSNGSPMRRMSEMKHIGKMAQIGIRGLGSSAKSDFEAARKYGSVIITSKEAKRIEAEGVLAKIPRGKKYFVTIDIDGFDLSIAPGVGSPSPGGLEYNLVSDVLYGIAKMGDIIAFDMVEVAPQYDQAGITPRVAAMTMLSFMGYIMKNKTNKNNVSE